MGALNSKEDTLKDGSWTKLRQVYDESSKQGSSIRGNEIELHEVAVAIDNVDKKGVDSLWESFVMEASSFAVDRDELTRIFMPLNQDADHSKFVDTLFSHWLEETKIQNPNAVYVDFMEIFLAVVFCSSMSVEDKAAKLFETMDFEQNGLVSLEAFALTLKSAEAGLIKVREKKKKYGGADLSNLKEPTNSSSVNSSESTYPYVVPSNETMIKQVARLWFDDIADGSQYFSEDRFIVFCLDNDREVRWIFDMYELAASTSADPDLELEHVVCSKPKTSTSSSVSSTVSVGGKARTVGYKDDVDMFFKAPWLSKMQVPTKMNPSLEIDNRMDMGKDFNANSNSPSSLLRLSYVHGYQTHNCRGDVRYSRDGQCMIYHAATVAIVSNIGTSLQSSTLSKPSKNLSYLHEEDAIVVDDVDSLFKPTQANDGSSTNCAFSLPQEYFREHSGEIRSMVTTSYEDGCGTLVATGEVGSQPKIHIWVVDGLSQETSDRPDSDMRSQLTLTGFHTHGVGYLAFAKKSQNHAEDVSKVRVISVGLDPQHRIGVYDLSFQDSPSSSLCCSEDSHRNQVYFVSSNPYNFNHFITGGSRHLLFWEIKPSFGLFRHKVTGKQIEMDSFSCAAYLDIDVAVVGCVSGSLTFVRCTPTSDLSLTNPTPKIEFEEVKAHHSTVNDVKVCHFYYIGDNEKELYPIEESSVYNILRRKAKPLSNQETSSENISVVSIVISAGKDGFVKGWRVLRKDKGDLKLNPREEDEFHLKFGEITRVELLWTLDMSRIALVLSHLYPVDIYDENNNEPLRACAVRSVDLHIKAIDENVENTMNLKTTKKRNTLFNARLLIGTLGTEVFELNLGGSILKPPLVCEARALIHGHWSGVNLISTSGEVSESNGGLFGLSVHPTMPFYATCGDDATLRLWNSDNGTVVSVIKLHAPARACCFSPDGGELTVGFGGPTCRRKYEGCIQVYATKALIEQGDKHLHMLSKLSNRLLLSDTLSQSRHDHTSKISTMKNSLMGSLYEKRGVKSTASLVDSSHLEFQPVTCIGHGTDSLIQTSKEENEFVNFRKVNQNLYLYEVMKKDAKSEVTEIKYSPDGSLLLVGSQDFSVYIYRVSANYSLVTKFNKHNSPVKNIEISKNNKFMRTSSTSINDLMRMSNQQDGSKVAPNTGIGYDYFISSLPHGKIIGQEEDEHIKLNRDVEAWSSWGSVLGWPVLSVWLCDPSAKVTTVHKSYPTRSDKEHDAESLVQSNGSDDGNSDVFNNMDNHKDEVNFQEDVSLIVTGDDQGCMRLFNFPCCKENQRGLEYYGHSSEIAKVEWSPSNTWLFSIGLKDRCIFQWEHENLEEDEIESDLSSIDSLEDNDDMMDEFGADIKSSGDRGSNPNNIEAEDEDGSSLVVGLLKSGGDEFMAVKPWLGALKTPRLSETPEKDESLLTNILNTVAKEHRKMSRMQTGKQFSNENEKLLESLSRNLSEARDTIQKILPLCGQRSDAPADHGLKLEWVHGFRSSDVRNNLKYVKHCDCENGDVISEAICFHGAGVGIVMYQDSTNKTLTSKDQWFQSFYTGHDDDVVSLAVHPNGQIVATGQVGKKPSIHIWSSLLQKNIDRSSNGVDEYSHILNKKRTLEGFHERGVSQLCFSEHSELVASIGEDDLKSIAVYNWNSGAMIGSARGDGNKVLAMSFIPTISSDALVADAVKAEQEEDGETPQQQLEIVTCGVKHIKFWSIKGRSLTMKKATLGKDKVEVLYPAKKKKTKGELQAFTCLGWKSSKSGVLDLLVGTQSGEIYVIDCAKRKLKSIILAHQSGKSKSAITTLSEWIPYNTRQQDSVHKKYSKVISGARDGVIHFWSESWELLGKIVTPECNPVTSLCMREDGNKLLVATQASEIYEVAMHDETAVKAPVMDSQENSQDKDVKLKKESKEVDSASDSEDDGAAEEGKEEEGAKKKKNEKEQKSKKKSKKGAKKGKKGKKGKSKGKKAKKSKKKGKSKKSAESNSAWCYSVHRQQSDSSPMNAPLITGHCKDELWGLATHPRKREYVTVGDDLCLKIWSIVDKKQISNKLKLPCMARAVDYYRGTEFGDDDYIAVGFGGSVGKGKQKLDGCIRIYKFFRTQAYSNEASNNSGEIIMNNYSFENDFVEKHDAKDWISDVKFSPNGHYLAIGSHDNKIYLYGIENNNGMKLTVGKKKILAKHSSYITHLDFTQDSKFLQSNCGAYELLFWDVSTGRQITSATDMKDCMWSTWTCTLGWPVQGIWPPCADGTDINTVSRSYSGCLIISGDDYGKLKMFRYPCLAKNSCNFEYTGHSSHVTNVRWSLYDETVISVGGNDRCVFQWRHEIYENDSIREVSPNDEDILGIEVYEAYVTILKYSQGLLSLKGLASESTETMSTAPPSTTSSISANGEDEGVDDLFSKPWMTSVHAPKKLPANSSSTSISDLPPKLNLNIDWVFGYNSFIATNNLFYTCDFLQNGIAFHAASIGIVQTQVHDQKLLNTTPSIDSTKNMVDEDVCMKDQSFFNDHQDEISCLAISQDRQFIATGSIGKTPVIYIWHAVSCALLSKLPPFHEKGIAAIDFSQDEDGTSRQLVSVGQGDNHLHAIWKDVGGHWSSVIKVATARGEGNKVFFARWLRSNHEHMMVSGGLRHINFWTASGPSIQLKKGLYGKLEKEHSTTLTCACTHFYISSTLKGKEKDNNQEGDYILVTASLSGHLYKWEGRKRTNEPPLSISHPSPIFTMKSVGNNKHNSRLIVGNNDGIVKLYNVYLDKVGELSLKDLNQKPNQLRIRSIDLVHFDSNQLAQLKSLKGSDISQFNSNARILVGTASSEVLELNIHDPFVNANKSSIVQENGKDQSYDEDKIKILHSSIIVEGHYQHDEFYKHDVVGLAMSPSNQNLFASSSHDGNVRIWNMKSKKCVGCWKLGLNEFATCIAWSEVFPLHSSNESSSPSSKRMSIIALGIGNLTHDGKRKETYGGGVVLLSVPELSSNTTGVIDSSAEVPTGTIRLTQLCHVSKTENGNILGSITCLAFHHYTSSTSSSPSTRGGDENDDVNEDDDDDGETTVESLSTISTSSSRPAQTSIIDSNNLSFILAAGSHLGPVFIGEIEREKSKLYFNDDHMIENKTTYPTHFDFSQCGKYLQCNWANFDLTFHQVKKPSSAQPSSSSVASSSTSSDYSEVSTLSLPVKKNKVTAKSLRDEKWSSWTCPLGWPVRGIWPISADGTEINTVDRSHDTSAVMGKSEPSKASAEIKQYLAIGDDNGKIKVYNYPCSMDGSNNSGANSSDHSSIVGSGHTSHVTNVKFSNDNKKIVSCGGSDRTVILWDVGVASDD